MAVLLSVYSIVPTRVLTSEASNEFSGWQFECAYRIFHCFHKITSPYTEACTLALKVASTTRS